MTLTTGVAQTITIADAPVAGDQVRFVMLDAQPLFSSGTGQQWTISGAIDEIGDPFDLVPVDDAEGAADFPDATVAVVQTGWPGAAFFRASASGLELLGNHETPGPSEIYVDTDRWLPYPCSFGTTWTDGYIATDGPGGGTLDVISPTTWTADGTGTLACDGGTFTDVLKCRTTRIDVFISAGDTGTVTRVIDRFWKPGYPVYVAEVRRSTYEFDGVPPTENVTVEVLYELAIGLEERSDDASDLVIYPDPAFRTATVVHMADGPVQLLLIDAMGCTVRRSLDLATMPGIRRTDLDLEGLVGGRYLLRVVDGFGRSRARPLIVE